MDLVNEQGNDYRDRRWDNLGPSVAPAPRSPRMARKQKREPMTETRTLSARHETVHEGILAGPNATLQEMIDSGLAWRLEGRVGRAAMNALKIGAVVLSAVEHTDAYGDPVPSYEDILDEIGAPGSVANAEHYAQTFGEWDVEMDDDDEEAR